MIDYAEVVSRIRVSYHEAAHAVIAELRGRDVVHVTIVPKGYTRGMVLHAPRGFNDAVAVAAVLDAREAGDYRPEPKANVFYDPVITLAGMAAELEHFGTIDHNGATDDRQFALRSMLFSEHVRPENVPTHYDTAFNEASELVRGSWATIATVADELRTRGSLTGDELRSLLAMHGD